MGKGKALQRAMVAEKDAQYIDPMLPAAQTPTTLAQKLNKASAQRWRLPWPGLCVICHRAQWQPICRHCTDAFAKPRLRCQRCALGLPGGAEEAQCTACDDYPPEFDRAIAAVDYVSPWRELIAQFKFSGDIALSHSLCGLLAARVRAQSPRTLPQWIIPTPLSDKRLRERGYNQTWHLAKGLSRELGIPTLPHALRRLKDTPRMMSLDADARRAHIRGAFEVVPDCRRALVGRHVAVVDDVLTTGATLNEITQTLMAAGARSVSVWVVARTPSPGAKSEAT